jgi:predicted ester cyclase
MSEENKAIVRRGIEEIWNKKTPALIDEIFATSCVLHNPDGVLHGPSGFRQIYSTYVTAFPDLHFTIEDIVAEGDKVVTCYTARGTHQGDLRGIAPTGKQVTVMGMVIDRFAGGKLVESRAVWDTLSFMQQLGVVSTSG